MIVEIELIINGHTLPCKATYVESEVLNLYQDTDDSVLSFNELLEIPEIYHSVLTDIEATLDNLEN